MVIDALDARAAAAIRPEVVKTYGDAWATTRYALTQNQIRDFATVLDLHLSRPDFKLVSARRVQDGPLLGFAYGYTSQPGGWWREMITDVLSADKTERWFADSFEFVELAILEEARGQGIGGRLHDLLLDGVANRTSILSTQSGNAAALALYRSRGWETVESGFHFPNRPHPYELLGLELTPQSR